MARAKVEFTATITLILTFKERVAYAKTRALLRTLRNHVDSISVADPDGYVQGIAVQDISLEKKVRY